jgi:hypothetical protein
MSVTRVFGQLSATRVVSETGMLSVVEVGVLKMRNPFHRQLPVLDYFTPHDQRSRAADTISSFTKSPLGEFDLLPTFHIAVLFS